MSQGPSLYRRHRPRTFADVVGQEHVVRTLTNAVEQGKVHHAYLFVGSRGTGKTSMAKILAACLNCDRGPTTEPCGQCESCRAIAAATSLDVIEMDAASNNSVEDVRRLRDQVAYAPVSGRHKVYILDEAHMLSASAWNALLKTLEEPPPNTIFVLATTEAQKVMATVVDRCHRFDFGRPTIEQIAGVLRRVAAHEEIAIPDEAVALIARGATGSFRDALGTLEQLITYSGPEIALADVQAVLGVADAELLFESLDAVAARDPRRVLHAVERVARSGRDVATFIGDLEAHARDVLVVQTLGEVPPEARIAPDRDERLAAQAERVAGSDVVQVLDLLAAALAAARAGADPRVQLELALVKAAAPELDASRGALVARIERLERAPGAGGPAAGDGAMAPPRPAQPAPPQAPPPSRPTGGPAVAAVAPEPVAEPVPMPAPPPADDLDISALRALWPAVLDTIPDNALLVAILGEAQPVALAAGELTIAFPRTAAFSRKKAEDAGNRAVVAEALRAVTGHALRVAYELRDDLEPGAAVAAPATEQEWFERFVAEFDAEEIDQEPREEGGA